MWLLGLVFNRRRITFRMFTQCIRSPVDVPRFKVLNYFIAIIEFRKCASTISLEETTESHFRMQPNPLTANMYHRVVCFYEIRFIFSRIFFLNDVLI